MNAMTKAQPSRLGESLPWKIGHGVKVDTNSFAKYCMGIMKKRIFYRNSTDGYFQLCIKSIYPVNRGFRVSAANEMHTVLQPRYEVLSIRVSGTFS